MGLQPSSFCSWFWCCFCGCILVGISSDPVFQFSFWFWLGFFVCLTGSFHEGVISHNPPKRRFQGSFLVA